MPLPPAGATGGFGVWPLLYGVYIAASPLRLEFALPVFTGAVAAVEYFAAAAWTLPLSFSANEALLALPYHLGKALLLLTGGIVAGLVARRIMPFVSMGTELATGQRVGLIRFGSRVDVYLPQGTAPQVLLDVDRRASQILSQRKVE